MMQNDDLLEVEYITLSFDNRVPLATARCRRTGQENVDARLMFTDCEHAYDHTQPYPNARHRDNLFRENVIFLSWKYRCVWNAAE